MFKGVTYVRSDILRAVQVLQPLGGIEVTDVGKRKMIRSVPKELNGDQKTVLEVAQVCDGHVGKTD